MVALGHGDCFAFAFRVTLSGMRGIPVLHIHSRRTMRFVLVPQPHFDVFLGHGPHPFHLSFTTARMRVLCKCLALEYGIDLPVWSPTTRRRRFVGLVVDIRILLASALPFVGSTGSEPHPRLGGLALMLSRGHLLRFRYKVSICPMWRRSYREIAMTIHTALSFSIIAMTRSRNI